MPLSLVLVFFGSIPRCGDNGWAHSRWDMVSLSRKVSLDPTELGLARCLAEHLHLFSHAGARVATQDRAGLALAPVALQFSLETLWTLVSFGLRRMGLAFGVVVAFWMSVVATVSRSGAFIQSPEHWSYHTSHRPASPRL